MRLLRRNIHYVGKLVPTTEACCKWQSGVSPGEAGSNMQKREREDTLYTVVVVVDSMLQQPICQQRQAIENSADAYILYQPLLLHKRQFPRQVAVLYVEGENNQLNSAAASSSFNGLLPILVCIAAFQCLQWTGKYMRLKLEDATKLAPAILPASQHRT